MCEAKTKHLYAYTHTHTGKAERMLGRFYPGIRLYFRYRGNIRTKICGWISGPFHLILGNLGQVPDTP